MSEKTPQSQNTQANADFEAFTAKRDKEKLIAGIIGDADANSERYSEGLAYYNHLETLANESDEQREARLYEDSLSHVSDEKFTSDWEEALVENTQREEALRDARIQNNRALSIAERATTAAALQHAKLSTALAEFNAMRPMKNEDDEAFEARVEDAEARIERIEANIESAVEVIEAQQAKDQEEHGNENDDIFQHFTATLRDTTTQHAIESDESSAGAPAEEPSQESHTAHESTGEEATEAFSQAIHSVDGVHNVASKEVVIDPATPASDSETFLDSHNPESKTPSINDPEFMALAAPEADEANDVSPKVTWLRRLKEKFSSKREHKEGENRAKHGKRVLGAVAAAALVFGVTYSIKSHFENKEDTPITNELPGDEVPGTEYPGDVENNSGNKHEADATEATKAKERQALMEADVWNVSSGSGGIALLKNLGLTEADWYKNNLDQKLLTTFPGTFYSSNGDVRIAAPGELPDNVKTYIIDQTDLLK